MGGGNECSGEDKMIKKCKAPDCPGKFLFSNCVCTHNITGWFLVHCVVSDWGEWSACNEKCAPKRGDMSLTSRTRLVISWIW